jgi:hypothetical protein
MIDTTAQNQLKKKKTFVAQESVWSPEIKVLLDSGLTQKIIKKIRLKVSYTIGYNVKMGRIAVKPHKPKWDRVEQLLVVAMLYHSGCLADAQKFAEIPDDKILAHNNEDDQENNE